MMPPRRGSSPVGRSRQRRSSSNVCYVQERNNISAASAAAAALSLALSLALREFDLIWAGAW